MESKDLTGIERQLVLQYLIDGNVPVTVTPVEKKSDDKRIKPLLSAVFPVALKAEQITVLDKGIILLKNPPQSVIGFAGKTVRVEFYFNRVGLFFTTEMKSIKAGLALVIPAVIHRIIDVEIKHDYDFSASIYYSCSNKSEVNIDCVPGEGFELFTRPVWSTIPLSDQKRAKVYLEQFVSEAKKEKNAGNGLQLIPICRYLVKTNTAIQSVQGRVKPFSILYVDHERIVFGSDNETFPLAQGAEYALRMSFMLRQGPVAKRDVFATCIPAKIYSSEDSKHMCADCVYTSLQEEDKRFMYEKATKKLCL
ncbi:MAG: hypothetical protein WCR31_07260 [Treponema sp.]